MIAANGGDGFLRPLPIEARCLAQGVFMTKVGADVVVLDLRSDTYACLPNASDQLDLGDGLVRADLGLLGLLADADLLTEALQPPRRSLPPLPFHEMPTRRCGWLVHGALALAAGVMTIRRLGPHPTIQALIDALPPAPTAALRPARLEALTVAFQTILPWAPDQGACLYRAFILLTMLRRAGQNATWAFGVRTWPFGAHCWLQVGDAVLDDDPERVSRYTPIMAL